MLKTQEVFIQKSKLLYQMTIVNNKYFFSFKKNQINFNMKYLFQIAKWQIDNLETFGNWQQINPMFILESLLQFPFTTCNDCIML